MLVYPDEFSTLRDFGIGSLDVHEAAVLIAKCLYCSGEIDIKYEAKAVSLYDEGLERALKKQIEFYEAKLVDAINSGTLKPTILRRNIKEEIDKESTVIHHEDLELWLRERGIDLGDLYSEDYLDELVSLVSVAIEAIDNEKTILGNPELQLERYKNQSTTFPLQLRIEQLERELSEAKQKPQEKSLSSRTRETTLKLIIGMAVKAYCYKPAAAKNTAIKDIASDLALCGIPLDTDTIRKWLEEASEFLPRDLEEV